MSQPVSLSISQLINQLVNQQSISKEVSYLIRMFKYCLSCLSKRSILLIVFKNVLFPLLKLLSVKQGI